MTSRLLTLWKYKLIVHDPAVLPKRLSRDSEITKIRTGMRKQGINSEGCWGKLPINSRGLTSIYTIFIHKKEFFWIGIGG